MVISILFFLSITTKCFVCSDGNYKQWAPFVDSGPDPNCAYPALKLSLCFIHVSRLKVFSMKLHVKNIKYSYFLKSLRGTCPRNKMLQQPLPDV